MKTTHSLAFFLLTCLMPLLAPAQSTVAAPGKPAKAGTAAVAEPAKPKPRLLTRDQLRRCFQMADDNRQEKAAIDAEIADFEKERAALEGETATLRKQFEAQSANAQSIRAEQAQLLQAAKEFETPVERAEMKAAEARRLAFNERATASAARVDEHNAANAALASANALLGPRTDANNLRAKKLQERADEHNYNLQDWQAQCANRPYDEADALLIRKESPK